MRTEVKDISILNVSPSATGFGRYAGHLSHVRGTTLYSFVLSPSQHSMPFPGRRIECSGLSPRLGWPADYASQLLNRMRFRRISRDAFGTKTDIVHFASQEVPPVRSGLQSVVTVHDLFALELRNDGFARRAYDRVISRYIRVYSRFKHVLTVSEHMRRQLESRGFGENLTVVHPAVSPSFRPLKERAQLRSEFSLPPEKHLVLSVSTLHSRKNLKTVVETMKLLGSDFFLVRVGGELGMGLNFSGLTEDQLNRLYNACDVLLSPSLDEGFGYPVVEAFAAGIPVVASDIDVYREVAGDAALLVEPVASECARAVREAIGQRDVLSAVGSKRAEQFTLDAFVRKMTSFYSAL